MQLSEVVQGSLARSVGLYDELIGTLSDATLRERLPGLPSNTIGQQLWCVVGARESYGRAIRAGRWVGFECSVDGARCAVQEEMAASLRRSGQEILDIVAGATDDAQAEAPLIVDLLEHEAAHQGQLIRYLYGLKLPIPAGWKSRYALK